jgi:hypothetical protein
MHTITILNHMIGIEIWCHPLDFKNWQLASERHKGDWLGWLGPIHMACCKVRTAQ